jgi:hypothetical protein
MDKAIASFFPNRPNPMTAKRFIIASSQKSQPVIPAKAKPRAGIQSVNIWMPDQVRHDKDGITFL